MAILKGSKPIPSDLAPYFPAPKRNGKRIALEIILAALSFALPFILLIAVFASNGFAPFTAEGPTTMMLDQRDQYVAYLRFYQGVLKEGGSLIYTSGKVFGGDFMSIFTYYLASPFNLLVAFISSEDIPTFFLFSAIVKLSFASFNFYLLCRITSKKLSIMPIVFGLGYALMSYNLVYMSNFMYLDVIMVLPLVILGMLLLEENRHLYVYPLALAYALFTSWYLGAMVAIFAVLFFLVRFIATDGDMRKRFGFALRFAIFSLLGGLAVAGIWLTAFLHFDGTKASSTHTDHHFFPLTIFFSGLLENSYQTTSDISRNTGYMTMFVGMAVLACALLYPFNRKYPLRERLPESLLFLLLAFASLESVLSAAFHGGKEPSWFPTRFSFLMGFLLCYVGAKHTERIDGTPLWSLLFPLACIGIALPIVLLTDNGLSKTGVSHYELSIPSLILYLVTLALIFVYLLLKGLDGSKGRWIGKSTLGACLLVIGCVSSYRGMNQIVTANLKDSAYASSVLYKQDCELDPVFGYAKSLDPSTAFRMEATFNRPSATNVINNSPLFYHYNGLNHYSSSEKKEVSNHMERLGFHINPFYETYEGGSTEAINAFLGVRYLIDDNNGYGAHGPIFQRKEAPYTNYEKLPNPDFPDYTFYENKKALPLGFTTISHSATFVNQGESRPGKQTIYWYDKIEYQNSLYREIVDTVKDGEGKAKDIFAPMELNYYVSEGLTVEVDEYGLRRYSGPKGGRIAISFEVPAEHYGKNLYFGVHDTPNKFSFTVDNKPYRVNDYFHSGIHGFADTASHKHSIVIHLTEDCHNTLLRPMVYAEDTAILSEYLDATAKEAAHNLTQKATAFSYGYEGDFAFDGGDKEFLFTLPYEDNIHIYLDGKEMPLLKRFDIFSAISLKGVEAGNHHIEIAYVDRPFQIGLTVSLIGTALLLTALIVPPVYRRHKRNPSLYE